MKLKNLSYLLLVMLGVGFISSCTEDTNSNDPSISVTPTTISTQVDTDFTVSVTAQPGDLALSSFEITEDGSLVDISRVFINGTQMSNNPTVLFNSDTNGFTYSIVIRSKSTGTSSNLTFTVKDTDGNSDSASTTVNYDGEGPTITFNGSSPITATPGGLFNVNFSMAPGSSDLKNLFVFENGELMEDGRVVSITVGTDTYDLGFSGIDITEILASGGQNIKLLLRAKPEAGLNSYTIQLYDQNDLSDEFSFDVSTGNQLNTIAGVLFNQAGPSGTGGLDLDNGTGTGSASSSAEIRDMGVDDTIPVGEENWRRQVSGVNGSVLRYIVPGQGGVSESFTFDAANYDTELVSLWDGGTEFSVSNPINVGDMVMVKNGDNYYLLNFTEVNFVADSNADNYVIDIKH